MNLFETVKSAVTVKQAAEYYGCKVNRGDMICCPFHDDRHPSMKLNEDYFYCFGCGTTGGGRQSPTIVAITSKQVRDQLSAYNAKVMHTRSDPYYGAPVILVVLADPKSSTFVEDGSCVLENMMLAAHALGLGSVWVHREREIFDSEEGKSLLRTWGLDQTLRGVGSIAFGYAAAPASPAAPRKENYAIIV